MEIPLPEFLAPYSDVIQGTLDAVLLWVVSPAAWVQVLALFGAYVVARIIHAKSAPWVLGTIAMVLTKVKKLSPLDPYVRRFWPVVLPLIAFALGSVLEIVMAVVFETSTVVTLGKRLFLFFAIRRFSLIFLNHGFWKPLTKFIILPLAFIYVLGFFDAFAAWLNTTTIPILGQTIAWAIQFIVLGIAIFWAGRWSNDQSAQFIEEQPMRPAVKQLSSKATEIVIFGTAFLILMNVMDVPLDSLLVMSGAVGVGLGFGLQKIAANFISGVILLLEGQATVGDYVALDNGEEGTIVKTTARAMILETFDGRWIVVPNEDFITTRVVNYSDAGSANRFEVPFSVHYDTDINLVPDIIEKAVATHESVLNDPYPPDCELRGFGDSGVDFAVEFWVNGLDDGPNKFTSDVRFLIWNALKEHKIDIPYPHRIIEMRHTQESSAND